MKYCLKYALLLSTLLVTAVGAAHAAEMPGTSLAALTDVQKYERAIHIMAMLLVGFGFLMVFVKKYGRSALTATYLLVSVSLPLYILKESFFGIGSPEAVIDKLILAEFAAASLLICAGAVLGRLKMHQYLLLGILFVPFYALNEWIVLNGGLGLITGKVVDTGGSIVIHAFGAIFG
jgi:ammonium transporter Rh